MTPVIVTKALVASVSAGICGSQTPVSGTPLLINGALAPAGVARFDTQRRVAVAYGNEGTARTLRITGTDTAGAVITETVAIPSGGAGNVTTQRDFLTVTQVMPLGGGWTAAMTVGTGGVGATAWQIPSFHISQFEIGMQLILVSGTGTATIECTREPVYAPLTIHTPGMVVEAPIVTTFPWVQFTNATASASGSIDDPIFAWRLAVSVGTGLWKAVALQSGIHN